MTRCILMVTFTTASLFAQQASAWEGLDNFIDDMVSCCTIDRGPAVDYGPPPTVYVPPPAPAPVVAPMAVAPAQACCPPPACCETPGCCDKMKACWQRTCDWWTSLCGKCCPGSTSAAPAYQTPYATPPIGTTSMMYGEQPYSVGYPPTEGYETYSEGPSLDFGPTYNYGTTLEYGPATGTTSEVIPAPMNSI
jgi:hypothetical protein